MRALIVEDETYNFESLKRMILRAYPQANIEGQVTNLIDLERAMLDQQRYDVVYCDIRLEDGVCFSAFEGIAVTTQIIFTTAYSEFALNAYNAGGIAYLLKPIEPDALRHATDNALAMGRGRQDMGALIASLGLEGHASYLHFLKANAYDGSYIIDIARVSHFVTDGRKSFAMMSDGSKHRIDHTLEQLMRRLDPMMFFRANRQYIVSRRANRRIQAYCNRQTLLKLANYDDIQVLVSKENLSALNS